MSDDLLLLDEIRAEIVAHRAALMKNTSTPRERRLEADKFGKRYRGKDPFGGLFWRTPRT
jgi:hypothetical protein